MDAVEIEASKKAGIFTPKNARGPSKARQRHFQEVILNFFKKSLSAVSTNEIRGLTHILHIEVTQKGVDPLAKHPEFLLQFAVLGRIGPSSGDECAGSSTEQNGRNVK